MIKYIVEVYIPAAQKKYDMRIPASSKMGEINPLVAGLASELSGGLYKPTGNSILINAENGEMYNVNMTAAEQGISNGTQLILI